MPTYAVTSVEGCLDAPKQAKIASEITRIQSDVQDAMDGVDAAGACRRAFEIRSAGDGRTAQDQSASRADVDSDHGLPVLDNMRSFRCRYTTAKEGIPASDRNRFVRTDKVVDQSGKRTRLAWKPARRAERRSGPKSA